VSCILFLVVLFYIEEILIRRRINVAKKETGYYFIKDWDDADHFVIISTPIVDERLTPVALALYVNLTRNWREYKWTSSFVDGVFNQEKPSGCLRSDEELAEACNTTIADIQRAKKELIECNLVTAIEGGIKMRWGDE